MFLPRTTIFALLLLVTLAISAKTPCDTNDPNSLCLRPLRKSSSTTKASNTIPSSVLRRRGGRGARAGAAGAIIGGAIAAGRRPRRGRRGGGLDDEDFEDEEDDDNDNDDGDGDGEDDDGDGFCFPANSLVTVKGRGLITMANLKVGDSVMLANGQFSPVFVFGHRVTHGKFPFSKIVTQHGQLTASSGHYIYVNGHLVTAATVKPGQTLQLANGQVSTVTSVQHVMEHGLYNPHTIHGELVVNGFRVSAYTKTVQPVVAKSMLAPIRAAFRLLGVDLTAGLMSSTAPKFLLNRLPKGSALTKL